MWWKRNHPVEPADVETARELREGANRELAELRAQSSYVARLSSRLIERRALNHFGDDIQITFTRKEPHAL